MRTKKKVMLINPAQIYFQESLNFDIYFPIGLLSIAASIKNKCEVQLYDCLVEDFTITKKKNYTRYGTPLKKVIANIKKFKPNIIGLTCPFSCQLKNSVEIANAIKKLNPNILIVLGGPDASVRGKDILSKYKSIDICVKGEGEITFSEIVSNFYHNYPKKIKKINGIIFRRGNSIIENANRKFITNLDKLPLPYYKLIDFRKYLDNPYLYDYRSPLSKNSISIITSRGCPYNCCFCSIHLHMGNVFRGHSSKYVLKHLKLLVKKYKVQSFHFEDDNLSFDIKRFNQILDGVIKSKIDIQWDTPNGIRADTLNYKLLKKIKKSGCKQLRIGIESGSQKTIDKIIKKGLSLKKVQQVAKWCKKLKIDLCGFYIIGFPGETIKNMKLTIDFALRLQNKYSVIPILLIATPLYGTKLYNLCKENNYFSDNINEENLSKAVQTYGKHLIKTKEFNSQDIDSLLEYFENNK
ncbi:B12-binding domain-containing radical SAM protein [Patescibacteria group bacterium]